MKCDKCGSIKDVHNIYGFLCELPIIELCKDCRKKLIKWLDE